MESGQDGHMTVISDDVEIVGSIKSTGDISFNGRLTGDLTCSGKAEIGAEATIKGNLAVDSTTVRGQINGNISAKDRIEFKSTAKINGDIRAKRLSVEDGVTFIGKSEVNPAGPSGQRPAPAAEGKTAHEEPATRAEDEQPAEQRKQGGVFARK